MEGLPHPLPSTIPWKLLQGIALVQLYLEERWVEPPRLDRLPFSLLYHQTMCTLASCGEMTPGALANRVLTLPYFYRITPEDYRCLLRHLLETDHLQRTETGGLIVSRRVGKEVYYKASDKPQARLLHHVIEELVEITCPDCAEAHTHGAEKFDK